MTGRANQGQKRRQRFKAIKAHVVHTRKLIQFGFRRAALNALVNCFSHRIKVQCPLINCLSKIESRKVICTGRYSLIKNIKHARSVAYRLPTLQKRTMISFHGNKISTLCDADKSSIKYPSRQKIRISWFERKIQRQWFFLLRCFLLLSTCGFPPFRIANANCFFLLFFKKKLCEKFILGEYFKSSNTLNFFLTSVKLDISENEVQRKCENY